VNQRIRVLRELGEEFDRAVRTAPPERAERRLRSRIGWPRHIRPFGLIGPALAVLVVAAVVIAAVSLVHPGRRHATQQRVTQPSPANVSRQQLVQILGVLRQPQSEAARAFARSLAKRDGGLIGAGQGTVDIPLVRYATTTPWGQQIFLVPIKSPTASQIAKLKRRYPNISPRFFDGHARGETLSVASHGSSAGGATVALIKTHGVDETEGAGRSFAGGSAEERRITVVPDGVAKVEYVFPRQPEGNQYAGKTYAKVLKVTAAVHNNVAAVQVDRECCGGGAMIWYAADGHVIRRIGSLATAKRVTASPKPGPQTPQSKAAQRDPSTPNHIWVTPAVGGPHTRFKIHFRVLLNGADYSYRFSGASCPKFTFPGGIGKPNALRGDLFSDSVSAVMGQALCPGTYHVAVTVMDLGRSGNLRHPAGPFGIATFTVR
jgi:hypothetical protein